MERCCFEALRASPLSRSDPSQFVSVLLRHQDALLRYILPLVGCFDDAQDVLQETATALWKKFDQYDPQQPFLPWARQFARNEVLMHHRRRKRYTFLSGALIESLLEDQHGREPLREGRRQALEECLQKLPEADRALIQRRYADRDASVQKLAAESSQTANALYKALGRIRRQLLECINRSLAAESV